MKHLTIIRADNTVYIDGIARTVDCSSLPNELHAVQWDEESSTGDVESNINGKHNNAVITSRSPYQHLIDAWEKEDILVKQREEEIKKIITTYIKPTPITVKSGATVNVLKT